MDVSKLKGMKRDISKSIQYDKTEWVDEQTVIDAAKLNKIEDALDKVITANNGVDDLIVKKTVETIKTESVSGLNTNNKTVQGAINELKIKQDSLLQDVSNGKSSIAQAITSKGVQASANDTFEGLSTKIKSIKSGRYDSGDTLKEGVHFKFNGETFVENEIEGLDPFTVLDSRGDYLLSKCTISSSGMFKEGFVLSKYNKDTDEYEEIYEVENVKELNNYAHIAGDYIVQNIDEFDIIYSKSGDVVNFYDELNKYTDEGLELVASFINEYNGELYIAGLYIFNETGLMFEIKKINSSLNGLTPFIEKSIYGAYSDDIDFFEFEFCIKDNLVATKIQRGPVYVFEIDNSNNTISIKKSYNDYGSKNKLKNLFSIVEDYFIFGMEVDGKIEVTIEKMVDVMEDPVVSTFTVEKNEYNNVSRYMLYKNDEKKLLYPDIKVGDLYKMNTIDISNPKEINITSKDVSELKIEMKHDYVFHNERYFNFEIKNDNSTIVLL